MVHSRENDFPFRTNAPQGVVHRYSASARESSAPPLPPTTPTRSPSSMSVLCWGGGSATLQRKRKRPHLAAANPIPHEFAFPPRNMGKLEREKGGNGDARPPISGGEEADGDSWKGELFN